MIQELKQSVSSVHMAKKDLKCFTKLCGNFDYKMSDGVLARCLGVEEAGSFPAGWIALNSYVAKALAIRLSFFDGLV